MAVRANDNDVVRMTVQPVAVYMFYFQSRKFCGWMFQVPATNWTCTIAFLDQESTNTCSWLMTCIIESFRCWIVIPSLNHKHWLFMPLTDIRTIFFLCGFAAHTSVHGASSRNRTVVVGLQSRSNSHYTKEAGALPTELNRLINTMVGDGRLELPYLAAAELKSAVSTNFTNPRRCQYSILCKAHIRHSRAAQADQSRG